MGNYLQGSLDIFVSNKTPKNILDLFYKLNKIFEINKTYSELIEESKIPELQEFITDDEYINPFPSIDFCIEDEGETIERKIEESSESDYTSELDTAYEIGIDDYSKFDYYCISIEVNCKRNHQRLDKIAEAMIQVLRPYLYIKDDNYIGRFYDEDGNFCKDYYIDRSVFYDLKQKREFLCKGCTESKKETLCDNYKLCLRAYKIGCKNQIESDFNLKNLDDIPSLKEVLENNTGVGN